MDELAVKYEANGQEITLTKDDVKKYLVSGDASKVTDKELKMFLELCKAQGLNPFLREAYLIKYGNESNIVTGKDVFMKRARANPDFRGFEAGIIVENKNGREKRDGTFYSLGSEQIVGGWARIHIKDWEVPFEHTVSLSEFRRNTATWKSMPAVMIRKVALVQALREVFPNELSQLYSSEELPASDDIVNEDDFSAKPSEKLITEKQRSRMFALAKSNEQLVRSAMAKFGYTNSTSEIKASDYENICMEIEANLVLLEDKQREEEAPNNDGENEVVDAEIVD